MIKKLILVISATATIFSAQTMHPKTYEGISDANKHIEVKEYKKAHKVFTELLEDTSNKRGYDLAFIHNAAAYLYIQEENYKEAINSYEKALSFNVLPLDMKNNIIYSLAQLSLQEDSYKESIRYLQEWHKTEQPTLSSSKLMMLNYISLEKNYDALEWCKKSITLTKKPELQLHQNQLALEISLDKTYEAIKTLEFIIANFSITKSYFLQLSYLYQSLGDDKKSVAVLESAYQLGLLSEYKEKMQLAQMLNYTGAAQKALQVVQKLLNDTNNSVTTLEYLAQLQLNTKEYSDAIETLKKLYAQTNKEKTAFTLAQLFASQANWQECEKYASYVQSNDAKMLLAIALAEQNKPSKAIDIFKQLMEVKEYNTQAKMWLEHIR